MAKQQKTSNVAARPPVRDMQSTGQWDRPYHCSQCDHATNVSDSSLVWVCNPMRFTGGKSICVNCGPVEDDRLRWEETNETIEAYRKRMFRLTPAWIKWMQFFVLPAIAAVLAATVGVNYLLTNPRQEPGLLRLIPAAVTYLLTFAVFYFSPLAGLLPQLAGYKYWTYR